jgi:hypothetical protein
MSDANATHKIWCLVDGGINPFPIVTSPTTSIGALKSLIKRKDELGHPAHNLNLWKVRYFYDLF